MQKLNFKPSLFFTLALIITSVVLLVLSLHTSSNYSKLKSKAISDMNANSEKTINILEKNIASYIESYAANEYYKIIKNEIRLSKHLAIIVEDYNTGNILGTDVYISGKIRKDGNTTEYEPENKEHNLLIKNAFLSKHKNILSDNGEVIGKISVYSSDKSLQKKLDKIITDSFIDFLFITLIMIVVLFISIYIFVAKPISKISYTLSIQDKDGIPIDKLSLQGPKEISALSKTINFMLDSIKISRLKIKQQADEIKNERDRFELAVDGTQDGLWDWNMRNDTFSYSDRFYEMLGYKKDDFLHKKFEWINYLIHPEDVQAALHDLKLYIQYGGGQKYESSFRMRKKNGDYLWVTSRGKAQFNEDGKAIRFVGFITDITKQVEHNKELDYTAKHDMLTDLPNRFSFTEHMDKLIAKTKQNDTHFALLYIDLDGFKEINDEFGHDIGDTILIKVAQKIKSLIRKEDFVARIGGDEFVVAIANLENKNTIIPMFNSFLDILRQNVQDPKKANRSLVMSASVGATFYPQEDEIGPEALLRQADQAMYDAKKLGKNQYHIFNLDIDTSSKEHIQMIQEFEQSLQNDEFVLHYQPKVNMKKNKIIGFEALLRWDHPEKGLIYPDAFLPKVNSEKELMLKLGEWVISNAFEQFSKWKDKGYDFTLNINISAHEFKEAKTFNLLKSLLEKHKNISPKNIEFEILETHAFDDISQASKMIDTFQKLGFKIALDDFGTGYSTLTYLKDLSINTLKIDKTFVMDMLHDRASLSILEATIALADAFGCEVIAEGVESIEHGEKLIQLGCYQAQGYVLSKPMPKDDVERWINSFKGFDSWKETAQKFFHDNSALYATVEHREWVKKLELYIKNPENTMLKPELDETKCKFSKWLNNEAKKHYSQNVVTKLNDLHQSIHTVAQEALKAKDPQSYMEEIQTLHKKINDVLEAQQKM